MSFVCAPPLLLCLWRMNDVDLFLVVLKYPSCHPSRFHVHGSSSDFSIWSHSSPPPNPSSPIHNPVRLNAPSNTIPPLRLTMRLHSLFFASLCASVPLIPRQSSPCESGDYVCCNSLQNSQDPAASQILGLLGVVVQAQTLVGLTCMSPFPPPCYRTHTLMNG